MRGFVGPTKSNPFVGPFASRGSLAMREYRLYCLDRDGECTKVRGLGATDDADALAQVEVMQIRSSCELWERARFIASFQSSSRV